MNYSNMVVEKEADKQNVRETAEKEIQQLNNHLKKTNQQVQSLIQEKVKKDHVLLPKLFDFDIWTFFLGFFSEH